MEKNSKKNGTSYIYREDGSLKQMRIFVNNVIDGIVYDYNKMDLYRRNIFQRWKTN